VAIWKLIGMWCPKRNTKTIKVGTHEDTQGKKLEWEYILKS
jgi:hypothetical protein